MLRRSILPAFSRRSLGRRLRRCSISGAASNTTARAFGHLFIFPIQHFKHPDKYAKCTTHCDCSVGIPYQPRHCERNGQLILPVIAASFAKQNLVSTQSVRLIASVAKQSSACTFLLWIASSLRSSQ